VVISGSKPAKNNGNGTNNNNDSNGTVGANVIGNGKGPNGKSNGKGSNGGPWGTVQIAEPAVTARCEGEMESGTRVRVRLVSADIATREVHLELVG
jgi:hypothetical protein